MFGPNITGSWKYGVASDQASTGAVTDIGNDRRMGMEAIAAYFPIEKQFDASLVSSIYGQSETVQPSALRALPCIKF